MTIRFSRTLPAIRRIFGVLFVSLLLTATALAARIRGGLDQQLAYASPSDQLQVIVTFTTPAVTPDQIAAVKALGINHGVVMQSLPIMGVLATPAQITALGNRADVLSLWANR